MAVQRGAGLEFESSLLNNREMTAEGDDWLTVRLPNTHEALVPGNLLNYDNPLSGRIFPFGLVNLSNQLFVPLEADTGSYELIGRIGRFPDNIIDQASFGFQITD